MNTQTPVSHATEKARFEALGSSAALALISLASTGVQVAILRGAPEKGLVLTDSQRLRAQVSIATQGVLMLAAAVVAAKDPLGTKGRNAILLNRAAQAAGWVAPISLRNHRTALRIQGNNR